MRYSSSWWRIHSYAWLYDSKSMMLGFLAFLHPGRKGSIKSPRPAIALNYEYIIFSV